MNGMVRFLRTANERARRNRSTLNGFPAVGRDDERRAPVEDTTQQAQGAADTQSPVVSTLEEILEKITQTSTPQASTGVLLDWSISMLKNALGLGGMAATADAVKAHVDALEASKDKLSEAVAATPE